MSGVRTSTVRAVQFADDVQRDDVGQRLHVPARDALHTQVDHECRDQHQDQRDRADHHRDGAPLVALPPGHQLTRACAEYVSCDGMAAPTPGNDGTIGLSR